MRLNYLTNVNVGNMQTVKYYSLQKDFIKSNINKLVKYFTNQRKKDSDLLLLVDYGGEGNTVNIYLANWMSVALNFNELLVNGYFTKEIKTVGKRKNYKAVLLSFCE